MKKRIPKLPADQYLRVAAAAKQCAIATVNFLRTFTEILDATRVEMRKKINLRALSGGRWTSFSQFPRDARETAHRRMKVMHVYYDAIERGLSITNATALAQRAWQNEFRHFARLRGRKLSRSMRDCSYDKIERLRKKIDKFGGPLAPVEAYLDGKACRHPNRSRPQPDQARQRSKTSRKKLR